LFLSFFVNLPDDNASLAHEAWRERYNTPTTPDAPREMKSPSICANQTYQKAADVARSAGTHHMPIAF
jgi:hypothetical protein